MGGLLLRYSSYEEILVEEVLFFSSWIEGWNCNIFGQNWHIFQLPGRVEKVDQEFQALRGPPLQTSVTNSFNPISKNLFHKASRISIWKLQLEVGNTACKQKYPWKIREIGIRCNLLESLINEWDLVVFHSNLNQVHKPSKVWILCVGPINEKNSKVRSSDIFSNPFLLVVSLA